MNTVSVNSRLVGNILDCSYSQSFHHSCPSLRYDQAVVHKLNIDLSKGNVFTPVCDSVHREGHVWGGCVCVWQGGMCSGGGMHGGGVCGVGERACMAGETAAASDDMHPTGMHSCAYVMFYAS